MTADILASRAPARAAGRLAVALAAAAAVSVLSGCRTPAPAAGGPVPGRSHVRGSDSGDRAPALSVAEALPRLERARRSGARADVIVYANRLTAAGGVLTPAQAGAVAGAIDALERAELTALWDELDPTAPPAGQLALRLGLIAAHAGEDDAALAWLVRVPDTSPVAERARAAADRIAARRRVAADTIAVLLPLTGRHAPLGAELQAGIALAGERGQAKLVFLDTAGDPDQATQAVDRAVFELSALAVLGPVGAEESRAAARRAVARGIPIALLSPEDIAGGREAGVFALWPSPEWEAREAVRLAVGLGYDRLAVLAPRDEVGAAQAEAFARAARAAGVNVVARGHYDPTATDLEPDLEAFLGLDPATNPRLRRHLARHGKRGWKTFSPDVAFDLLYVPDGYERAALVASYLPFFNVEVRSRDLVDIIALRRKHRGRVPQVVQLLGSSGWHHPGLIPRGGPAVEGALIVEQFSGGDNEDYASESGAAFAAAFHRRNRRTPTALAAQAHDAAALVLAAHAAIGPVGARDPRAAFGNALVRVRLTDGACGSARVGSAGTIEREAILLRVDGGGFVLHEY